MPKDSKRPCKRVGCPALVQSGYCSEHADSQKKSFEHANRSRESKARQSHYDTVRWKKVRKRILARDPICQDCGTRPSAEVDHIIPLAAGGDDSEENLQGLCKSCHSSKTMKENKDKYDKPKRYEYDFDTE